jgi:hypothetical protein
VTKRQGGKEEVSRFINQNENVEKYEIIEDTTKTQL